MSRGIYFIGGASVSGKSTCARILAQEFDVKNIELDGIYKIIKPALNDELEEEGITKQIISFWMDKFVEADAAGILEGGWLDPEKAANIIHAHGNKFQPVYCGYPRADANIWLEMLVSRGTHWLARKERKIALMWLNKQIEGSRWYESECRGYGIPFFDFSDVVSGSNDLQNHYRTWRANGTTST